MKRSWFLFFLRRSIAQRKGRIFIAASSVTLAVAVMTGMLAITLGIRGKLGEELKAYGANIIVSPQRGDYLDYSAVGAISKLNHVGDATGQVFGVGFAGKQEVEIIGLEAGSLKGGGWRLLGSWPGEKGEILAGINLKDALKLDVGKTILLAGESEIEFVISGFIERGGPEDSAFVVPLPEAWELLGLEGKLSAVLVGGKSGELDGVIGNIRSVLPGVSVKTLRQVALAEESLLSKIQLLMALVTIVVLFAAVVSVAGTMGANLLERREEIGLMKALGAERNTISLFYMAETALSGFSGGAAGFLLGCLFAEAVSKGAFNSLIGIPFYLPFFSLTAGLIVSLAAGHFPVRDATRHNAAVVLRGE
ncbi:MAG: FtsX-like permease family protein [Thermodesulfovibrionales bacterium]